MYQSLNQEELIGLLFQGLKLNPNDDFLILEFNKKQYKLYSKQVGECMKYFADPCEVTISVQTPIIKLAKT